MKPFITKFKVSGALAFPLDMLRYDGCYPCSSTDAAHIGWSLDASRERLTVELAHVGAKTFQPTEGRWSSFGWVVERDSVTHTPATL